MSFQKFISASTWAAVVYALVVLAGSATAQSDQDGGSRPAAGPGYSAQGSISGPAPLGASGPAPMHASGSLTGAPHRSRVCPADGNRGRNNGNNAGDRNQCREPAIVSTSAAVAAAPHPSSSPITTTFLLATPVPPMTAVPMIQDPADDAGMQTNGQNQSGSTDIHELLIREGNAALAQNRIHDAAEAFQKAVDINPSSAKGHEGLGVALSREIMAGNDRPSADFDVVDRAESHLRQASDLSPSATTPLLQLSELEAALAERATDYAERSDRYGNAQNLLKRAVSLEPSKADLYLKLANLERDQFGPAIQQAKARFSKNNGPLPDSNIRHALQQQYGSLIDDAISNAQAASQMNGHFARPLLLTARLLRERALIRDTPQEYSTDMHSADDWQGQFMAVGGHLDQGEAGTR